MKEFSQEINYLSNIHIINSKIYDLLNNAGYKLTEQIKSSELYFIGNKKICLLFPDKKEDIDEIGFINIEDIFIPEYIIEYQDKNNSNSLDILNNFFKKEFYTFYSHKNIDSCEIKDNQNKVIGNCFKLNNNSKNDSEKERNIENPKRKDNEEQINFNNCSLGLNQNFSQAKVIQNPNPNLAGNNFNNFGFFRFNNPPLIGLKNVGATCYMNSVLQCLSKIEPLAKYFKSSKHVNNTITKYKQKNEDCLTESFKILIDNLWPDNYHNLSKNSNNCYYAPYDFKNKISKMNPLFQGVQANDAKDLVNFIIMTLHKELNKNKMKNSNYNDNPVDQRNKYDVLNKFIRDFIAENKSIISDLFYFATYEMTKCLNCQIYRYNFQTNFFLIFPLEEVRKYKLQEIIELNQNLMKIDMNTTDMYKIQNNLRKIKLLQNNSVDILDCLDYNQKIENFTGENAPYCNTCKDQKPAEYQTKIFCGPNILILVLNRGTGIQFKVKLQFDLELDLNNYLENKTSGCVYDLIGVVTHKGESGASGHFIASCKSPVDNNWYQYNDDLVNPIKNFKEEILDFAMPYILFYKNRK